jgi:SpoVK/Ycf46/Vps4 family AAA+-type ATPase
MTSELSTATDTAGLLMLDIHVAAMSVLLRRLDALLLERMAAAQAAREQDGDPLGGMYIAQDEVARLLAPEPPGAAACQAGLYVQGELPRLDRLVQSFGLSELEIGLLIVALAPELDARYPRIFGYLQDDMTRRRPAVGLALDLLCSSRRERLAARHCLAPNAPLLTFDLVRLLDDPDDCGAPLPSRFLAPDPWLASYLLGGDDLDPRLASFARIEAPRAELDEPLLPAELRRELGQLAPGGALICYFRGPDGVAKRAAASAICHAGPLLVADGELAPADPAAFQTALRLLRREAALRGASLYWDGLDTLLADDRRALRELLLGDLAGWGALVFLAGQADWAPADTQVDIPVLRFEFPRLGHAERARLWAQPLGETALAADVDLADLASTFRLSAGQIRAAAATARNLARRRDLAAPLVTMEDLAAACRLQSNRKLAELAHKITPHYSWDDIVLPADRLRQLREVCNYVAYRALVYDTWGFDRKLAMGKGLNVLFAGPSGTGKTMAADIMAGELGLDLYKIDLSTVVSKYIGETEKNLARIFAEAETSNAILFFDEADALFGKRSEVKDAHDRYANIEISYLLQKMEEYEGVVILATNLRKNMDEAFVRRMHFTVEFPFPGEQDRRRIWEQIWPERTPREAGLDLGFMARHFEIAGGNIRNVALAAAFLAAADGGAVTMAHLIQATQREYQKIGKLVVEREFGEYAQYIRGGAR